MQQSSRHPLARSSWYLDSQDFICLSTHDGSLLHMNPAFLDYLGWEHWEGKSLKQLFPAESMKDWLDQLKVGPETIGPIFVHPSKSTPPLKGELVLLPIEGEEKVLLWVLSRHPGRQEVWQKLIQVSRQLLSRSEEATDNAGLNEVMHAFSGALLTAFNRFEGEEKIFKTVALAGPQDKIMKGLDFLGFHPMKRTWSFDENKEREAAKANITYYEHLEDLTGEVVPRSLIRQIQSIYSLGPAVVIQIHGHQRHLGDFTLLFEKGMKLRNREICEIFASLVGLHLERNEAEEKRQEHIRRHEATIEATGAGTLEWDLSQKQPTLSQQCWSLLGLAEEDNSMETWLERVHPQDRLKVEAALDSAGKIFKESLEVLYRIKHASGQWRWLMSRSRLLERGEGQPGRWVATLVDVTDLKTTQEALLEQKDELDRFFSVNLDLLCIVQTDGRFVRVNKAWETTLGYPISSLIGENILDLIHPDDREPTKEALKRLESQEEVVGFVNRYRCQDGSYRHIEWRSKPYGSYVYAAARDISQRINIEAQLHLEKEQLKTTLLSVADGVLSTDPNGRITLANQAAGVLLEWKIPEMIGRTLDAVLSISDNEGFPLLNLVDQVVEEGEVLEMKDYIYMKRSGEHRRIEGSVAPVKDRNENITGTVVVFRDVTERVDREKEVEYFSFHDALTGLYNRRYMEDALLRLDAPRNLPLTLLFADINGLKLTNDAYGHRMGDALLQMVAEIMKEACRADDILCRIGGDEFALLLPQTNHEQGLAVKERIFEIAATKTLEPLVISIGVGVATKSTREQSLKEVQSQADQAMYQDKLKRGQLMRGKTIEIAMKNICKLYEGEEKHIQRVSLYCQELARGLHLSPKEIEEAKNAGLLHDIGKIALAPEMLNKKGPLGREEWREVRKHPLIGYHILKGLDQYASLAEAVLYHHEHYDGSGYPRGLKGKKIPLLARMIAIADSFEAMTGKRSYRKSLTEEEAIQELRRCSGQQYDPGLVKVFIEKVLKAEA